MSNTKALTIIRRLLTGNKISLSDAVELAAAIPSREDTAEAAEIRNHIEVLSDFSNVVFKGRPRAPKMKGSDITNVGLTVRDLEAVLRLYWRDHKRNNAEMGRIIALLETLNYIIVPTGGIEATVKYFIGVVNYIKGWDIKQIRREYSRVCNLGSAAFNLCTHKERPRIEKCLQSLKATNKNTH